MRVENNEGNVDRIFLNMADQSFLVEIVFNSTIIAQADIAQ